MTRNASQEERQPTVRETKLICRFPALVFYVVQIMLVFSASSWAQAFSAPELQSIFPCGGQAGTDVEVVIKGKDLEGARELVFSTEGFKTEPKEDAKGQEVANTFVVHVPKLSGSHQTDVRVLGQFGLSNPRFFSVSPVAEVLADAKSTTKETAQNLTPPCVINGRTPANAAHWFKIHAGKGQHVFAFAEASDLDTRVEAAFSIHDASGKRLAKGTEDSPIDFTVPSEGDYLLQFHDLLYRGGDDYGYRFSLSDKAPPPRPYRALAAVTAMGIDGLPVIKDTDSKEPLKLSPPCIVEGRFAENGRVRDFQFEAKKGDVYAIEIVSHREGYASDPVFIVSAPPSKGVKPEVLEAKGFETNPAGIEYSTASRDAFVKLEVKEDGVHHIHLHDGFNTAPKSPRQPYRMIIRRETPDFALLALPDGGPKVKNAKSDDLNTPVLRRGGITALKVTAFRRDGFAGDIVLKAEGLPLGVACSGTVLHGKQEVGLLTFRADNKAEPWHGAVHIKGVTKIGDNEVVHEARAGTLLWNVADHTKEPVLSRLTDDCRLSLIAEDAPVLLEASGPEVIVAAPKEKVKLALKIVRHGEASEGFKVKAVGLGNQDKAADLDIPAKAATANVEIDLGALAVAEGEYDFVLQGSLKTKRKRTDSKGKVTSKEETYLVTSAPLHLKVKKS